MLETEKHDGFRKLQIVGIRSSRHSTYTPAHSFLTPSILENDGKITRLTEGKNPTDG